MKIPKPLEKDVQKVLRDYLRAHGWLVMRHNSGAMRGEYKGKKRFVRMNDTPGMSDLQALKNGVCVFIEVKRPGGKATAEQASFLEDVRSHGGVGIVADGLDSLRLQLEEHGL